MYWLLFRYWYLYLLIISGEDWVAGPLSVLMLLTPRHAYCGPPANSHLPCFFFHISGHPSIVRWLLPLLTWSLCLMSAVNSVA